MGLERFVGLMSGTSLDGVDGVLAERAGPGEPMRSAAHVHVPFAPALRAELLALNRQGSNELHRAAVVANEVARAYADVVVRVLAGAGLQAADVRAAGAHGQTVRHAPTPSEGRTDGYTVQLLNGALLAELCGIDVVCDFRSRDVAAGGEGAPLVPAFHAATFGQLGTERAVLNLGGIANLSLLRGDGSVIGFDTGPANVLLDVWAARHLGTAFDAGGTWAAGGQVQTTLLAQMLADPYFARRPPKSTGRDLFDADWLTRQLAGSAHAPRDVAATLVELTVQSVADALREHAPLADELYVCGGGAFNTHLLQRLAARLPGVAVHSTAAVGVAPDQVEALAFAWLASACLERRPGNLPTVTGARGPRVLGAIYPAN